MDFEIIWEVIAENSSQRPQSLIKQSKESQKQNHNEYFW